MTAPAMTSGGMVAIMTSVSSQPCAKATMKPPKNVTTSWMNFPTCSTGQGSVTTASSKHKAGETIHFKCQCLVVVVMSCVL